MYLRILKKDLKRKLTMNIILFVFIVLAAMFISSSANNIFAVIGGTDHFMDMAGVPDMVAVAIEQEGTPDISDTLDTLEEINRYEIQRISFLNSQNLRKNGEKQEELTGSCLFQPFTPMEMRFFDADNQPVTDVAPGTVWLTVNVMNGLSLQEGDRLEITYGNISKELTVAGCFKDASCIGGRFVVGTGADLLAAGKQKHIPYMAGSTSEDMMPPILLSMARSWNARQEKPSYTWYFDRQLPGDHCGAWHSSDLWYWFGTLSNCWRPMTEKDHALSDQMTDYLCNFAKTGNPNKGGVLPTWIASDKGQNRVLRLGEKETHMGRPNKLKMIFTMLTNKAVGE